jgi:hypothetical protein
VTANYAAFAFAAFAALAFAKFATSFALAAGDSFLFGVVFLAAGFSSGAWAALTPAQCFFVAAMIAFLPAAESLRLAFGASGVAGDCDSDSPRILAHLAF